MIGLKERLIQIVLISGVSIAGGVAVVGIIFYFVQERWNFAEVTAKMEANATAQARDLAASFLIPEQSAGREFLLKKYIADEGLTQALVINKTDSFPPEFSNCKKLDQSSACLSQDGKLDAVIIPISASDVNFGYLLKTKPNSDAQSPWIFGYVCVAFIALALVVMISIILIYRVHKKITDSLESLEVWTGCVILGESQEESPRVAFLELNLLGANIKRLIDEGGKLKKQAVAAEITRQVAHDIRDPVTALSIAVECIDTSHLPERDRLLIMNATKRINEIANDLTAKDRASRLTTANRLNMEPSSLFDAIQAILSEKHAQLRRANIEVVDSCDGGDGTVANIDIAEFKRVISNLITNSIQAIDGPGRLEISLGHDESRIEMCISDTGRGIPPHVLKELGGLGVTHGKLSGSGRGVYNAFNVIRAMAGDISFKSEPGCGTTVRVSLPRFFAESRQPEQRAEPC